MLITIHQHHIRFGFNTLLGHEERHLFVGVESPIVVVVVHKAIGGKRRSRSERTLQRPGTPRPPLLRRIFVRALTAIYNSAVEVFRVLNWICHMNVTYDVAAVGIVPQCKVRVCPALSSQ